MTQDATNQLKADAALTRDIEKATTPDEIRALLHAAVERSTELNLRRDPVSGQFVRRDPLTPAHQQATDQHDEPAKVTKVEKINGRDFTFSGTADEVERQIKSAKEVAAALTPAPEPKVPVVRQKTQAEIEREISDRAELDLQFRRGQLTTEEYLTRTNAVGEFLAARGFDLEAAAQTQMNSAWSAAVEEFLHSPAGADWPGGTRNREQLGMRLTAMGLTNAEASARSSDGNSDIFAMSRAKCQRTWLPQFSNTMKCHFV